MPAIDTDKIAPREAVRQSNKHRSAGVRRARKKLNEPKRIPGQGNVAGPPTPTPPEREFRPSGARRAPEATPAQREADREKKNLEKKGRPLHQQEQTIQHLVDLGVLPDRFKSGGSIVNDREKAAREQAVAEINAMRQEQRDGHGPALGQSATIFAKVPGVGGKLDDLAHTLGRAVSSGAKATEDFIARGIAQNEGSGLSPVAGDVATAKRGVKDFADMPVQAVPALWKLAGVPVALAMGDTKALKEVAKSQADNTSAGQLLVHGDPKKALKLAEEHPGNALLEATGIYGAAGRVAGAAGRVAPSAAVRRVFSQGREDLHVHGNVSEKRGYSPNALTKLAQVTAEHHARRKGRNPNEMGDKRQIVPLVGRTGAEHVNHALAGRVHATGGANEVMRRTARAQAKKIMSDAEAGMKSITVKGRRLAPRQAVGIAGTHHEIMGLLAQKIVRRGHVIDDLKLYRKQITAKADELGKDMPLHERKTNEALVEAITKALDDKNLTAHPEGWFDAAETYITHRNAADQELHAVGLLTDEQMAAKYLPALQVHEGVHFDPTTEKTGAKLKHEEAAQRAADLEKEVRRIESELARVKLKERGQARHNQALERRGRALPGDEHVVELRAQLRDVETELRGLHRETRAHSRATGKKEGRAGVIVARTERRLADAVANAEKLASGANGSRATRALSKIDRTIRTHERDALAAADRGDEVGFATAARLLEDAKKRRRPYEREASAATRVDQAKGRSAGEVHQSALGDLMNAIGGEAEHSGRLRQLRSDRKTKQAELRVTERGAPRVTAREGERLTEAQTKLADLQQTLDTFRGRHGEAKKEARALAPRKGERTYRQNWKDENGNPINTTEGQALAESIGAGDPGFLSHNARRHGAGAYHQGYGVRPERDTAKRTGQSIERGSNDNSWRAMTDDLVGAHGKADAAKAWDRMAREFGVGPQGKPFKGRDARKAADEYAKTVAEETGVDMTAVRLTPLREQADVLQRILDSVGEVGDLADVDYGTIMERSLDAALGHGPGDYIVVPASVLKEWRDIATGAKSNTAMKAMQVLSQNFRRTVLPLSPKWLAGNLIEASLRSLFYGHGPVDWYRGVKALKMLQEHNPAAFEEFTARTLGGRLYGSAGRSQLHRGAEQFPEGSKLRKLAHAGGVIARYPGVRQIMGAIRKLQDGVFGMNEWIEDQFATAAIGAKVKSDIRATSDSLQNAIRVQQDAMKDYVEKGLTDTNKQHEFATHLNEVLGRYSSHSPAERWMIQTFVPFWDWYRNSLKFVLVTLPTKHPIKTGLIASTEETMKSEQENEGNYSVFQSGGLPGFLKGSIANKDGTRTALQRYLPFGAFSDPIASAGDLILPQISGQSSATKGQNWKGTPFTKGDGTKVNGLDLLKAVLYGTAASQLPGLSIGQRFREHAGSAYDDSNILSPKVRAGSEQKGGQVANKIFNPFFPVQPNSGKKAKGKTKLTDTLGGLSDLTKAASGGAGDVSDLVKALGG